MVSSKKIGLRNGYITLTIKSDVLILESRNILIELRPRTVVVRDNIKSFEERDVGKSKKKKIVYIDFSETLKLFVGQGEQVRETLVDGYEIRRQDLGFDEYLTIITPGTHLYDYIILSSSTLAIVLSGKRQVYFDKEDNMLTIYIV